MLYVLSSAPAAAGMHHGLCSRVVRQGAACMVPGLPPLALRAASVQVWPTEGGVITATALDAPSDEEEGGSSSGWHTTVLHAGEPGADGEALPGISITSQNVGSFSPGGQGSDAMQELVSHIEGLMEGEPWPPLLPHAGFRRSHVWLLRCWPSKNRVAPIRLCKAGRALHRYLRAFG